MKILLISHNPITRQSNMGITFLSLFSRFFRDELCQLYIYPTVPDEARCHSFYRMTDKDALRRIFTRKNPGGVIAATQGEGRFEKAEDEALYRSRKNKSALRRLLRDAMWKLSGWYSRQLRAWLAEEKPDCVFVAPGVAKFLYDMALHISRERKIPVVTYICDEYYFVEEPEALLDKLRLKLLRRRMEKLMAATSHLVTITPELAKAYSEKFGVKTTIVMTGASGEIAQGPSLVEEPDTICYYGNIRCNRYVSLAQVGRALDRMNAERGSDYRLKIYSFEKDPAILGSFQGIASVELCPGITGEEFQRTFQASELLMHTEAFDRQSVDFVKHSLSTKIADSLASGIPLLAYGPEDIASMEHLRRHDCALMAASQEELPQMLERAFTDARARREVAARGLETAKKFHDSQLVAQAMRQVMESVT